jgi:hypothetical protein
MKGLRYFVLFMALSLPLAGWGGDFSNAQMLEYCETYLIFSQQPKDRAPTQKDAFETGLCKGLIFGTLNGYYRGYQDATQKMPAKIECMAQNVDTYHIALAFQHWLRGQITPTESQKPAYEGLLDTMEVVFRCPEGEEEGEKKGH